jgi:hypothetical protein
MSATQFSAAPGDGWAASGYLKHLLLGIKPLVKAMQFTPEQLARHFGLAERPSMTYAELVEKYSARLAEGVKAEDYEKILPSSFRMPEDVVDEKTYLLNLWNESNARLIEILEGWQEVDLDRYQLPHPALGLITVREMLFFTLHHNTLHWHDIERASSQTAV